MAENSGHAKLECSGKLGCTAMHNIAHMHTVGRAVASLITHHSKLYSFAFPSS